VIEESPEVVVVLDRDDVVLAASRRARAAFPQLEVGARVPSAVLEPGRGYVAVAVPYTAGGHAERMLFVSEASGDVARYEELRVGFTAAVSHELRTPLARQLALLDTAALPGEDVPALIEQARGEVEHMRELIDEVLFLSELESGREVVSLGTTRAAPVLREVADAVANAADRAGVRVVVEADDEGVEVPLRDRMLRVVVRNLVENAVRYGGSGSTCTMSARRVGDLVVLAVRDTGPGVAPEHLPRLFERFYRADAARSSRGTGLGLAIVKHIVSAAGGTVEPRSRPGEGLAVTCTFPAG
jgi:two-component system phosphate regulon sensor histidine kinase PhoR